MKILSEIDDVLIVQMSRDEYQNLNAAKSQDREVIESKRSKLLLYEYRETEIHKALSKTRINCKNKLRNIYAFCILVDQYGVPLIKEMYNQWDAPTREVVHTIISCSVNFDGSIKSYFENRDKFVNFWGIGKNALKIIDKAIAEYQRESNNLA